MNHVNYLRTRGKSSIINVTANFWDHEYDVIDPILADHSYLVVTRIEDPVEPDVNKDAKVEYAD